MKIKDLLLWLYVISLFLYYVDSTKTVKFLYYTLPFIGIILSIHNFSLIKKGKELINLSKILILILTFNLIIVSTSFFYEKFFQEGFLLIGSLIFISTLVINGKNEVHKSLDKIFIATIVTFMAQRGPEILTVLSNPSSILAAFITSDVSSESSLAFYFTLFGLYYMYTKDRKKMFLSIFFMIISFKRISLVAFSAGFCLIQVFQIFDLKYNKVLFSILATITNMAFVWSILKLVDGSFDEFISNNFGVSSNYLFMGRVYLYKSILIELDGYNLLGNGIGKVSDILMKYKEMGDGVLKNLHSDIFKYYLELGAIVFILFIFNMYYQLARNKVSFCFLFTLNIIFLTDNVSIYFTFMSLFYLTIFVINRQEERKALKFINNTFSSQLEVTC